MNPEMLNRKLKTLRAQLEQLAMMFIELDKAKATLEGLKGKEKVEEALVPVSTYLVMKAEGLSTDKVYIPLGLGYYGIYDIEKGIEQLSKMRKRLEERHEELSQELRQSEAELVALLKQSR